MDATFLTIMPMTDSGSGSEPGQTHSRSERRAHREHREQERRRRLRRRLLPLTAALVVVIALVVWAVSGGTTTATAPTTTTTRPAASTTTTTSPVPAAYLPPPVKPTITPALAGEGQWTAEDPWSPAPPAVLTTSFRPDPNQPSIIAYASWMRSSTTQLALFPGYKGPGETTLDRGPEMVPVAARQNLLATFNSGFYEDDAAAGFYADGTLYFPMVNGLATVVSYTDGTVDIVDWQGGTTPPPDVAMARQNLPMLVEAGSATPASTDGPAWGVTLGGVPAVWRTGLGIDAKGNLIYVAAPEQTAASLAQILIQLGSVRAMQLDINPEWPIFVTYGGPGAADPALDVPNPNQISDRFLYSSTKDFFALFQRIPGVSQQPW